MLSDLAVEKVCFLVVKAREYDVQADEPSDDASNPTDDGEVGVFSSDPSIAAEITGHIEAMDIDEQAELVALMWVGRGDFSADEWTEALAQAKARNAGPTARYILETPLVSDYLEEGLSAFDLSCEDFEKGRL